MNRFANFDPSSFGPIGSRYDTAQWLNLSNVPQMQTVGIPTPRPRSLVRPITKTSDVDSPFADLWNQMGNSLPSGSWSDADSLRSSSSVSGGITPLTGDDAKNEFMFTFDGLPQESGQDVLLKIQPRGNRRLHVSNIPFRYTAVHLNEIFKKYGEVAEAEVIYNERGSKGFGFVTMQNEQEARLAKEHLDGAVCNGRIIEVNEARPRQPLRRDPSIELQVANARVQAGLPNKPSAPKPLPLPSPQFPIRIFCEPHLKHIVNAEAQKDSNKFFPTAF